jgi:pimeloyl-ACP methyl ester carboxylesterase
MLMAAALHRNGVDRNAPRAGLAFIVLLAICRILMPGQVRAEQITVEDAARAAGLAVETGVVTVNGAAIYYRDIGPRNEALLLLHGFPETGDAFAQVVVPLGKRYRLIVPDLRGAGRSERTPAGYDKKTLANDVRALMDHLKIDRVHVVGHDIGARIAYAFAVQYSERLLSLTVAEAFIEGLAGTAAFKLAAPANPRTRHFARFARVDEAVAEYQDKEEELVLSFMNSRSKSRTFVGSDVTRYTESLRREGGLRAAFMNYEAFDRDAAFLATTDTSGLVQIPALAIVCQTPFGNNLQRQLQSAGLKQVKAVTLDGCAHWIYEENPEETLAALSEFLRAAKDGP